MERWQKIALSCLSVVIIGLGSFSLGFSLAGRDASGATRPDLHSSEGFDVVHNAYNTILSHAVEPPDEDRLARGAIKGMMRALRNSNDPYALFYSPSGYESFQELTTGHFSGIGVWVKQKQNELHVISVLPHSPARAVGLERGDVIESIDGKPFSKMTVDEAVNAIKGPEGTEVTLRIERAGDARSFTITRANLELPNVIARMAGEGQVGYLRMFGFARGASRQARAAIKELKAKGAQGVVLDLRDNGGGLFSEAIEVASLFIERGKIVTFKEANSPEIVYQAEGDAFDRVPMVVLVNEGTASASEIVAGALQDRERAVLVGSTTYGKGSVQEVVPLPDSSALKLTTGAYVTPNGKKITDVGIEPDVEVDDRPVVQKQRAVEILRGIVLSASGAQG